MKPVIAVVGYSRSGKGEVAKILESRGFVLFSGGDYLRRESIKRGRSTDRIKLIELGNQLRAEQGSDFLMRAVVDLARDVESDPNIRGIVVDSIRNPGEVSFLKARLGALVINIWAPDEERWERTRMNPKPGDPENWYEFVGLNAIDRGFGQDSTGQNIAGCVALADLTINNDSTLTELGRKVDEFFVNRFLAEGQYGSRERL